MLEPRKRTAIDGKVWWVVFDTDTMKYVTLLPFGKYKTKKACQYDIDCYKKNIKTKLVDKDFLAREAKRTEKFCLNNYGKSMTWVSIVNLMNRCVLETNEDDGSMIIDLGKYKDCCGRALMYAENE